MRTGLRKGELPGLRWEDLELAGGTASIRRTLQRTNTAGLTAPEVMMLTELWWGLPHGLYLATRHWPDDAIAAGLDRLRRRGLVDGDPPALTDAGIAMRADLERATDAAELPILDALSAAELDELLDLLAPWADAICQGGGYPANPSARTLPGLDDE